MSHNKNLRQVLLCVYFSDILKIFSLKYVSQLFVTIFFFFSFNF